MKRAFLLVIAGCSLASSPTIAADTDLTTESSVGPVFHGGELQGCQIVFDVAHRDLEYRRGQLVHVAGSVNYNVWSDRAPSLSVKIGVDPLGDDDGSFIAPAEVYIVDGNRTNQADKLTSIAGEIPGFRIFAFRASEQSLESLLEIAQKGHLQLGYAMNSEGMLSLLDVDVRVKRLDLDAPEKSEIDKAAPQRWVQCIRDATEIALG